MRSVALRALAVILALGAGNTAMAQRFPTKSVTLVLPFAAGGPTDTIARVLAEHMRVPLGQTVIVENMPGAAGTVSVRRVVRADPDGYTLSLGPANSHVFAGAIQPVQYDVLQDLSPIAQLATNPSVIVSATAVPAKTLKELIDWVKANQDKVSAGTTGPGSGTQLGSAVFQSLTGTKFPNVVYKGAGPAMLDLVAGQITLMFDQIANSIEQVRGGKIRAYAVMDNTRSSAAPDIPTVDEAGMKGFYLPIWHGLWAPAKTPPEVMETLNNAVVTALASPELKARFSAIGQEVPPVERQTPQGFAAYHKAEVERWVPFVKAANPPAK